MTQVIADIITSKPEMEGERQKKRERERERTQRIDIQVRPL